MAGPPEEACRAATADDVERLSTLVAQAIAELQTGRGGAVWARAQARQLPYEPELRRQIEAPDHQLLVGTLDGSIVGYGMARVQVLPDGGRLGVVDDLYTEPRGREVGLGELVMNALVDWCRAQQCFGVDSLALPGDRHTKNFFESFGLVARAIVVHRSLL